ncbi:hypothetical protein RCH09_003457 [Actimicrobium sp. GrIS 1.19]|uniref:hypothetical protein n=1 Tax=Actimicrobium sp. GrIS 1.19 TaxID=3071708 RepID=UPI002E04B89E|nr:hypothetical protein [Actimicrobium sp. GrIS 1.19]
MDFTGSQLSASLTDLAKASAQQSVDVQKEMQALQQQAAQDALWNVAQQNAMARVKNLAKLAESANQTG